MKCSQIYKCYLIYKKMKKFMFLFVLMLLPIVLFAQGTELPPLNTWFATFIGLSTAVVALAALLNTWLKVNKGWVKQVVAWLVAIILMIAGNLLNLGFMAELTWGHTLIYGIASGLVANGIFDIEFVKALLRLLGIEPVE